ncbi:Acyl-CoA synthetase (AMP-forming)/AMP-acid ligase II [Rhizobiales bacterium GAS191]|nr:Acyl-CoA synthetase (AMP-forming)/AMP-acid ligase II [Rhizobiales bacterium GAS113]SEF15498.1 Acyl-CoA synthetase (AMP-forming)/AMP-acid ligase II [Rhizobiales bacterium GAS191]
MINARDAMRRAAAWNRDRTAIISNDRSLTFAEAWTRGIRLANGLLAMGLKPQDRIAVLEDNCIEASDFFLAAAIGNFARVPLYKRNAPEAHAHMIGHTGCRAVVVSAEYANEIEHAQKTLAGLEHVIVRDGGYEDWLARQSDVDPNPAIDLDDIYIIRHSGGTTGLPKGMAFSHRQWMNMERDWITRLPPMEAGDACTHVAPISHGSGYVFIPIWMAGGYNVLEAKFEARKVLKLLSQNGGYMFTVPTMVSDLVGTKMDEKLSFAKMKALVIGGSPILPATALAARELFGPCLHQMYGETEATPAAWMTPQEWFSEVPGSQPLLAAGKVMPFAYLEIRDQNNKALPVGEIGTVTIQNDGQVKAIWNEPDLTKQRLVDGWLITGDVGKLDENGYLYLVDRKDDMIISGGFNIWPAELEIAISTLPEVREVAVVRGPHERWGETPIAIVVLHEGKTLTEQQVIDVCNDKLGALKRPTKVVFRTELLPRTPVGKVQRRALRDAFWAGGTATMKGS